MRILKAAYIQYQMTKIKAPPAHMRTIPKICKEEEVSETGARRMISELVASGAWVRKRYSTISQAGIRRDWYYGPKK